MTLWVPAERLAALIDAHAKPHPESSITRKLFDFRHGRQGFVSLDAADRMLTELDLHYLLYIPRENGGLADIYEDGVQYGKPNHAAKQPRPARRKYGTDEERREARLATYRRYYERNKERRAA